MSKPVSLRNTSLIDFSRQNFNAFYSGVLLASKTKGKHYLLLEGPTDAKVLKKFFNPKIISVPCTGRNNVAKVFERLPTTITNVFGIADRDYDLNPLHDFRLFYYDDNNFEMMVVENDALFNDSSLFNGYQKGVSFSSADLIAIRNNVLLCLFPISVFRKINMEIIPKDKRIGVSRVYPNLDFCMSETKSTVITTMKRNMLSRLPDVDPAIVNTIITNFERGANENPENYYSVTQGHDFVELFIKKVGIPSDKVFYDILARAYKTEHFKMTKLYSALKQFSILQMIDLLYEGT